MGRLPALRAKRGTARSPAWALRVGCCHRGRVSHNVARRTKVLSTNTFVSRVVRTCSLADRTTPRTQQPAWDLHLGRREEGLERDATGLLLQERLVARVLEQPPYEVGHARDEVAHRAVRAHPQ